MAEYRRVALAGLVGAVVTLAVLGIAFATATAQPEPFDGAAVAVAIIDAQMEQTRRQVINLPVDESREACAAAAWRPAMHHAVHALEADPKFAGRVDEWAAAWGEGLVLCYRGDMWNASEGIAAAYDLKESMLDTVAADKKAKTER